MKILLTALNSKFVHTNLAIRYIKSCCKEYDISIAEYSINDSLNNIIAGINIIKPDILGFSCYIWNMEQVLKVCSSIKKINPGLIIVLGGPEVSFDYINLMKAHDFIDYIIKGEGELASKELFGYLERQGQSIESIEGIVYRKASEIIENGDAPFIENLDILPFPYGEDEDIENKILYYESSRGCPYNCSYCLSSTIKGVRFFSLDRIKKDLMWFIDQEVKLLKFVDRTFNCSRYTMDIFQFLAENSRKTKFHFEISGDILDDKTLKFLENVRPGLFQFEIGVQSTNNTTLDIIDRRTELSRLEDNVRRLRKNNNINLHLDLIAGLPQEDFSSFRDSFDRVFSLKPHMLQLGFLKMLKGSKVREEAQIYGMEYNEYPPYEVLKTSVLSFDELSHLKDIEDTVDRYYNSGRFECGIEILLKLFDSPFMLFEKISRFENYILKKAVKMSNENQYKLLYEFGVSTDEKVSHILKECLAFDYLKQGRNPSVPSFLEPEVKISKEYIWELLSDKDFVEKYIPQYKDKSPKDIQKNIHIRKFSFDICRFVTSGEVHHNEVAVVFDYGLTDPWQKVGYICI